METFFTGALEDPRSIKAQGQNWSHEEVFGRGPYIWKEKPESEWKSFPIRNQNGSGKCGPFSLAKALGINNFIENGEFVNLDTDFIYGHRTNEGSGMWMDQLFNLGCSIGSFPDPLLLSDNNNDQQSAERFKTFTEEQATEALKFRGKNRLYFSPGNFDGIAQAIEMGYTPIFRVSCAIREWTVEPFVDPTATPADFNISHFVAGVDAFLHNQIETVKIEDSWGSSYGANGARLISRHFFNNRITHAGYIIDLRNDDTEKPKYMFNKVLTFGSTGPDVKALQKILQYEKWLPTHLANGQLLPFGYFGPMTAWAVKKWQIDHGIMDFANEVDPKIIRFGKKSIALANSLYS